MRTCAFIRNMRYEWVHFYPTFRNNYTKINLITCSTRGSCPVCCTDTGVGCSAGSTVLTDRITNSCEIKHLYQQLDSNNVSSWKEKHSGTAIPGSFIGILSRSKER